ncbi:MAG: potassium channel protein [Pyrinomonadaceae bacterium]
MQRSRLATNFLRLTRQIWLLAALTILLTILFGAIGFALIENLSLIDAVYLATQTVVTVGYGDLPPKSEAGRIFATVFMLVGGGAVVYALSMLAQELVQSGIVVALSQQRRKHNMSKLQNHFIVCGAGRVGARIIKELKKQNCEFVVLEADEKKVAPLIEAGEMVIVGDATLEENLKRARVSSARGLAACLPDDADNVYVVLTARDLNKEMHIVARAIEEQAEPKLIRAGANRVVAPTIIGSLSMARALIKPAIADFMDSIVAEEMDLVFEDFLIEPSSVYAGKKLKDTNLRTELDLVVIAIRRGSGERIFHPSGETEIEAGDLLILIGRAETMQKLLQQTGKTISK